MKRAAKVSLLTKILQEGTSHANRLRLQQVIENTPRSLILIDDLDCEPGTPITDSDPVSFQNRGVKYQMTLGEAHQYAHRHRVRMLFILPAKRPA